MDQNLNKDIEFKDRLLQIFKNNRFKIYFILGILISSLFAYFLFEYNNNKKNELISEKYVRAGLYLTSGDKTNSKILLEEIILSKNKFYSVLALNKILEKNLVEDKNKINEYFIILDTIKFNDENKDLIIFKKALYLIKNNETETGNKLLKKLIKKGSYLKPKIEEIIEN